MMWMMELSVTGEMYQAENMAPDDSVDDRSPSAVLGSFRRRAWLLPHAAVTRADPRLRLSLRASSVLSTGVSMQTWSSG
jgi:hypothetical protein